MDDPTTVCSPPERGLEPGPELGSPDAIGSNGDLVYMLVALLGSATQCGVVASLLTRLAWLPACPYLSMYGHGRVRPLDLLRFAGPLPTCCGRWGRDGGGRPEGACDRSLRRDRPFLPRSNREEFKEWGADSSGRRLPTFGSLSPHRDLSGGGRALRLGRNRNQHPGIGLVTIIRASHLTVLAAVALLLSCQDTSGPAGPEAPEALIKVSGDGLTAPVGSSETASVRVTDVRDRPLASISVSWAVTEGEGSVAPETSRTDASGEARTTWTLGTVPGSNVLAASVEGLPPVTFSVTTTPGPPTSVSAHAQPPASAPVGGVVMPAPAVVLRDTFGNPVSGAAVTFSVLGGGGSLAAGQQRTDAVGVATVGSWTLGTAVGPNTLAAMVGALKPVVFTVTATPGMPAALAVSAGDDQSATVGTTVSVPPAVMVLDEFENPTPGQAAAFEALEGSGFVEGSPTVSDERGIAEAVSWTLGTTSGPQRVRIRLIGVPESEVGPLFMEAQALADAPVELEAATPQFQEARVGLEVPASPAVLVRDGFGNVVPGVQVPFSVVAGGGRVEGSPATTDADGIAALESWTLGTSVALNRVIASVEGVGEKVFEADGRREIVSVEAVHLNQANQDFVGTIGGVAGRPGLLRVVLRAQEPNTPKPNLLLRLYVHGSLVREEIFPASGSLAPLNPDLSVLTHTWNMPLAASEVLLGLSVEVLLDPDSTLADAYRPVLRYPRDPGTASLDVAPIPPLNVVFIPIHSTRRGETGKVNPENASAFLESTLQWIPSSTISAAVRPVYSTDLDLTKGEDWSTLLGEIRALRIAENATDEYYHGIVPRFSGMAYGGLAYRLPFPRHTGRAALSHDDLPAAASTVAHELGHNMGRRHTPCGDPPEVDPDYPYPGAVLGQPGWDILSGSLMNADAYFDYMSYCRPRWTSYYIYGAILEWRRADPLVPQAIGTASESGSGEATPGLLVWGHINDREVVLKPAFTLTARPVLPVAGGPHQLRGLAADGAELFRFAFSGVEVAGGPDPDERHFAYFVPLRPDQIDAIESIELSVPRGRGARSWSEGPIRMPGLEPTAPDLHVHPLGDDRLRIRWDADDYPMAMVRERSTGRILSFARDGNAYLSVAGVDAGELEILLSDGVRSRPGRPE